MEESGASSRIFLYAGIAFAAVILHLCVQVYLFSDYLVLTTEEEIDEFKADRFGPFAEHI